MPAASERMSAKRERGGAEDEAVAMSDVLLVIDVQAMLVDALSQRRRTELLDTIRELISNARSRATPIVYVRHGDQELVRDSPGWQIAVAIAPAEGDPIVDKHLSDSFRETDLAAVLSRLQADHLIVCGMQTEYCIDATVREAERRGYRVTLVGDAHATYAVDGSTEEQIRDQVHRVLGERTATIKDASAVFV